MKVIATIAVAALIISTSIALAQSGDPKAGQVKTGDGKWSDVVVSPPIGMIPSSGLTIADLPEVLKKIGGCDMRTNYARGAVMFCRTARQPWASVGHDGNLTIFYRDPGGNNVTGSGKSVEAAVRDLAHNINANNADGKAALDAIAPLLPTQ